MRPLISVRQRCKLPFLQPIVLLSVVMIVILIIYLSFLSIHYDPNGIIETMAVESGDASKLFLPRRILYRPVGYALWQLLRLGGYDGRSLLPLQVLSATFGALGVGTFLLVLRQLTGEDSISLLVTGGYAFSYGYWVHSEDVYYIIPATFFVLVALYLLVSMPGRKYCNKRLLLLTLSSALAVCFWQTNIFFVPVIVLGLVQGSWGIRDKLKGVFFSFLYIGGILGGMYLGIGYFIGGCRSVEDFVSWMTTYSTALPMWGIFDLSRLKDSAITVVATIVPLHYGFGLRSLLQGEVVSSKLISLASLVSLILLFLGWGGWAIKNWRNFWGRYSPWLSICLVWLAPYALFNTWWDPYEVKWWIAPVITLWITLAFILTEARNVWNTQKARLTIALTGAALGIIALANFAAVILPHHSSPDQDLEKALAFGSFMEPEDLLVSAAWDWTLYVPYFSRRNVLNLIAVSAEGGKAQETLDQEIASCHQQGGRVFLVNVYDYPDDQWTWLTYNTGLVMDDFVKYERRIAWQNDGEVVWQVAQR
jgi:hypothetical protein